jgi:uncharacterized protein involved in type VI secretion and phage assembly
MPKFYGKYRGKVVDNVDPLRIGRIQSQVPAVSETNLSWALPCAPYAGPNVGFYAIPPIGANVWIEFEGGDPSHPIWSGGFWETAEDDSVPPEAAGPEKKVWQTDKMVLVLDDSVGEFTAKMETANGTMGLTMNDDGLVLTADTVTLTVKTDSIELKQGPAAIKVTEEITLKKAAASLTVLESIALKNGGASAEVQPAAINLRNGGASINMNPAIVNINNGALEVM